MTQAMLELSSAQADCEWAAFTTHNDRVPMIGDARKPWTYRGWLIYYVLMAEECLDIPKRWDYWGRTMEAGHILDEPIPQIVFAHGGERAPAFKHFSKLVDLVEMTGRGWNSFNDLLRWILFGLGQSDELPSFGADLHEQLYRNLNLQPFLEQPSDYIGDWICARRVSGWNPLGFFPTPHDICEMMVRMQGDIRKESTVMDPCAGTGRMLLHASNYSLRLYGMDIDQTVLNVLKINGALYCPWMIRPFPEEFFQ